MAKALAITSDGSKPLKNNLHERYARLRAAALPRIVAFREAGNTAKNDHVADANSCRLERKRGVRERIEFLTRSEENAVKEKRTLLEERLWAMHEADIGDYLEKVEIDGKTIERPKHISELPRELQQNIEKITVLPNGRAVPQLYSKLAASQELRKMLSIGRSDDAGGVARMSDQELVAQLAELSQQLGVDINVNYSFVQQPPATEEIDGSDE